VDLRFGGIHALRGVSFEAAPAQVTAIIGPNGAGKTSVFNTISGFYRPAAGRVRLGGEDITRVPVPRAPRAASRAPSRTSHSFAASRCSRTSSSAGTTR
jgi:branched-chain amino acid transport system ATP-binding protein